MDYYKSHSVSDKLRNEIDSDVIVLLKNCYTKARKIITQHRKKLDNLAKKLLEKEIITGVEFKKIVQSS